MLECTLVSPLTQVELKKVTAVYVRAVTGELGILSAHASMVCRLADNSTVRVMDDSGEHRYRVGANGFLRVRSDQVVILSAEIEESADPSLD